MEINDASRHSPSLAASTGKHLLEITLVCAI